MSKNNRIYGAIFIIGFFLVSFFVMVLKDVIYEFTGKNPEHDDFLVFILFMLIIMLLVSANEINNIYIKKTKENKSDLIGYCSMIVLLGLSFLFWRYVESGAILLFFSQLCLPCFPWWVMLVCIFLGIYIGLEWRKSIERFKK